MDTLVKEKLNLKCSNVDWCGNIPKDWRVEKIKAHFKLSKERASADGNDILSLTQKGIKIRDISGNEGQMAASYDNYAKLRKGDIVLNPMDLISGYVDLASQEGIISPAYTILRKKKTELNLEYAKHYFQWHYIFNIFFPFGKGVSIDHRWTLGDDVLLNFPILFPPMKTQEKIADFLNKKTTRIDHVIDKKRRLIEFLREERISIITKAVTKGIDPSIEVKGSGIEWLEKIPKEWTVKKIKFVTNIYASNIDKKSCDGEKDVLLCNYVDAYKNECISASINFMKATATSEQIEKLGLMPGDVIITKDSETPDDIGVPAMVLESLDNLVCGYHLYLIRSKVDTVKGKYLFRLLQAKLYRSIFETMANGVTRYGIGSYGVKNVKIIIPPAEIQKQIINYIDNKTENIDQIILKTKKQIEKLKEYRSSLIYNAVTGKIKI